MLGEGQVPQIVSKETAKADEYEALQSFLRSISSTATLPPYVKGETYSSAKGVFNQVNKKKLTIREIIPIWKIQSKKKQFGLAIHFLSASYNKKIKHQITSKYIFDFDNHLIPTFFYQKYLKRLSFSFNQDLKIVH